MPASRRRVGIAALVTALAAACATPLALRAPLDGVVERAGLRLEAASILDTAQIGQEQAESAAREAFVANGDDGQITTITLVKVSGPGNTRLGWEPADHRLAYAIEWTDEATVGLTLVSGVTGEVLFVTAY